MGEKNVRFIVNELNVLLGTNYNMISFDSLPKNSLIQVCADVLTKFEAIPKMDVEKNTEESLTRILESLSNMKIPTPEKLDANEFADGIINGKRSVIHPILYWILSNQEEVKKRAYFAKFLIKVPVPVELTSDPDLQQLMVLYDNKIKEFKKIHLENTKFAKMGKATLELRKEIDRMTNDLVKVNDQLEKQRPKVDNIPNKESLLVTIRAYRNEVLQEKELEKQMDEQKQTIQDLQIKIKKAEQQLQSKKALRLDSADIIGRLRDEVHTLRILVKERLPQELEMLKKQADLMSKIVAEPEPSEAELEDLQKTVDNSSLDLQKLMESTLLKTDPKDDKLAQFRQHVTVIANNKQIEADTLLELKEEVSNMRRKVEEKEKTLHNAIEKTADISKSLSKDSDTTPSLLKDSDTIPSLLKDSDTIPSLLKDSDTIPSLLKDSDTSSTFPKDSDTSSSLPKDPDATSSLLKDPDTDNDVDDIVCGKMPQGEELKKYVSKLRARSIVYKEHRAQLQEMQAELGVLNRTLDILKQENPQLIEALDNKDTETKDETKDLMNIPEDTPDLINSCKELAKQVNAKKSEISATRQELQSLKTNLETVSKKHERAKEIYESSVSNFAAEIKRLENEVKEMEEAISAEEDKWKNLTKEIEEKEDILQKLKEEETYSEGRKTQKDILNEKIDEQKNIQKELIEEMQKVKSQKEEREQQVIMWYSTLELLKCKKQVNKSASN